MRDIKLHYDFEQTKQELEVVVTRVSDKYHDFDKEYFYESFKEWIDFILGNTKFPFDKIGLAYQNVRENAHYKHFEIPVEITENTGEWLGFMKWTSLRMTVKVVKEDDNNNVRVHVSSWAYAVGHCPKWLCGSVEEFREIMRLNSVYHYEGAKNRSYLSE